MKSSREITDIWFCTSDSLAQIAEWLGLSDVLHDYENYWEWCIGSIDETRLDVTRSHTAPARRVPTRIYRVDGESFSDELKNSIVSRLRPHIAGSIHCGQWRYIKGNDFELDSFQEC